MKRTDWQKGLKIMTQLCAVRDLLEISQIGRWKVKGWKNVYHANLNQKKIEVTIHISDKAGIGAQKITRDIM